MREIRTGITDVDEYLDAGIRAKQANDADRWRREARPRELRSFAAAAQHLPWSRALLKAIVADLYPDDVFATLVGNLDRIPRQQWPRVLAIAIALRHSWRRDGLTALAQGLRINAPARAVENGGEHVHPPRPPRRQGSGSPRRRQGSPLRGAPALRGSRP